MVTSRIEVSDKVLKHAAEDSMSAFLKVFTDKYLETIGGQINTQTMSLLNGYQHALLSFRIFVDEVETGGFIQLIQNGYGPYIFDNPFAKAMRLMGAKDFSKLIYDAKAIYDKHKEDLEKERTEEEFMAMYEQYDKLGDLDDEFLEMQDDVTEMLAHFVDEHIGEFATVKNE
ncbi:MAG: DMP19 family protein [Phocaeicola sp.]|uniref:DMP19 family protein n=1 Tax=Phocaeicola TaxID=909656 RepID=UPI00234F1F71|nr:DMP19 family protein [Phocaeicola oris]MCE2616702.1 DMP19 family protein [Phocaeicola oris]